MKLKTAVEWACVSGLAMMVCLAQGGPLEDAKQLAASGRHGEVDAALEPLDEAFGHDTGFGRQRLPGEGGMDGFFVARLKKR